MKRILIASTLATTLLSCAQNNQSTPGTIARTALDSIKNVQPQQPTRKYIDTQYEYRDATGTQLTIQNSLPKSGIHYTDPAGNKHVYAVFWTRVINEGNDPFELAIHFPLDTFELPAASGNYMKLLIPSDSMTAEKVALFDYGLAVKPFLDEGMHTSSSLKRTIPPKDSTGFYVVTVSDRGVGGTLRTGLRLQGQNFFYRVNDKEIPCGQIGLKK